MVAQAAGKANDAARIEYVKLLIETGRAPEAQAAAAQ